MEQPYPQLEYPREHVRKLVTQMAGGSEAQRAEAEQQLYALGPEAMQALFAMIEKEARSRRVLKRRLLGLLMVYVVVSFMLIDVFRRHHWHTFPFQPFTINLVTTFVLSFAAASQFHQGAVRVLSQLQDVRAIGPLIESLGIRHIDRKVVIEALTRLLPRLQPSDDAVLNGKQRACLYRELNMRRANREADFLIAILKALEQVGDSEALPAVERLGAYLGRTPEQIRVGRAARECLPFLREHIERARVSQTLLRPAHSPDTPADTLLRPVQGTVETDAQILLRPSAPQE